MRQVVEVVTDLYANELTLFKLSPENIVTHFEMPNEKLGDDYEQKKAN